MGNAWTPKGFPSVTPYLMVEDAQKLIDFMKDVFDAEVVNVTMDDSGRVANAEVRIGHGVIEASDASDAWPATRCALHVFVPDTDACYRKALAAGAATLYEPADMPYGERSAGVKDAFGNSWFIATFQRGEGRGYYD